MERFAGRYAILRPLGSGGMGSVDLALDRASGRECALKRLRRGAFAPDPESLRREFEVLSGIRHPLVVQVLDFGHAADGTPWYTMEYVPGAPLHAEGASPDWRRIAVIGAQVATGLEALHAHGIVHGDLKPGNILALPAGDGVSIRLVDFGLAGVLGGEAAGRRGTPGYVAPEVARGASQSVASDLYGLGAVLFERATGRVPGPGGSTGDLHASGMPETLARLILRLLASEPSERPASAREVRSVLEDLVPAARRSLAGRLQVETLIGRERELGEVERWLAADAGGAGILFLAGDAGVGRSAMLAAIASRAALTNRRVCRLSCAARSGLGIPGAIVRHLTVEAALEGELAPQDAEAILAGGAEAGRALSAAGTEVLVLLDDAERLEPDARGLLRRLALHPDLAGVRWIEAIAGSQTDLDEEDQLLVTSETARLVTLGPLGRAAADRLVASRLQAEPPTGLCEALWERAGGHPGLLIEMLRAAADGRALRESDGRLELDAAALAAQRLPRTLEEARRARFDALDEAGRRVALLLAAVGRDVPEPELRSEAGADGDAALAALARSGLAHRDDEGRWGLSPPGLAEPFLAPLSQEHRRALHARALQHVALSEPERFEHLRGAGCVAEALACASAVLERSADGRMAVAAARLAEERGREDVHAWRLRAVRILQPQRRYQEAIPILERLLEEGPGAPDRSEVWHLYVSCRSRHTPPGEMLALIAQARSEPLEPRFEGLILCARIALHCLTGELEVAREVARQAQAIAERVGDDFLTGWVALGSAGVAASLLRTDEVQRHCEQALQAFTRADCVPGRISALSQLGWTAKDSAAAETLLRRALAEAREHRLRWAMAEVLERRSIVLMGEGRLLEARDVVREHYRIGLESGFPRPAASALGNLHFLDVCLGDFTAARRIAPATQRMSRRYFPFAESVFLRNQSHMLACTGREREARRALRRARCLARGRGQVAWCQLEAAIHSARRGRWSAVRRACLQGLASAEEMDGPVLVQLHALLGRADVRARDLAAASARLETGRNVPAASSPWHRGVLHVLEAELRCAEGRVGEAVACAEEARSCFVTASLPGVRAAAEVEIAAMALGRQGPVPAEVGQWLADAIASCERQGDHALRERALALEVERLRRIVPTAQVRPTGDLLRSVGKLISSLSDLSQLTQRAMVLAVEQLGAERGVLLLQEEGAFVPVAEHGLPHGFSAEVVEVVTRSGGSLLITDAPSHPGASPSMTELGSILCVPLVGSGKVVGAVYLDHSRRIGLFGEAEKRLLENFAELVAAAIEKSRGHEAIQRENELLVGENLALRRRAGVRFQSGNFIARSATMQDVLAVVERAAQVSSTVLITGENGTGKEMVARILHHSGRRRSRPFVAVNCGAIPATLLESELFGILPNVATGVKSREGRFIEADGGTLFLDEIGEMPPAQQVALLSVLSNREVTPVGGGRPIKVDVRIIAATNQDLRRRVEEGGFREDLFYRLNVIPIEIPPLRKRKADIPALARHFAANFAAQQDRAVPEFSADFMATLMQSEWPGNVRELQNYIERVMAMTAGPILRPKPLPHDLSSRPPRLPREEGRSLLEMVDEYERRLIERALTRARGNQTRAAEDLRVTEHALRYRIRKHGLPDFRRFRQKPRKSD